MRNVEEQVILVDNRDNVLGLRGKQEVHLKGLLHRAISIFVFNDQDKLMMQQRASHKYHSALLWANTCCGHPRQGETVLEAGHRRLVEEMGFDCLLEQRFHFVYRTELDNGLIEHEFDHVLLARYEGVPKINPEEVADWQWITLADLARKIKLDTRHYAAWLRIVVEKYGEKLKL